MEYTKLGRTGLRVSKLGFGTGGHFCLGQRDSVPEQKIHRLIREALDLGYNLFDTSPDYLESELILRRSLKGVPRDSYFLSDKVVVSDEERGIPSPTQVRQSVEYSLKRLGVDTLDILLVAGSCLSSHFERVRNEHFPVLDKLKKDGKIRFVGSSEKSSVDGPHDWLKRMLEADLVDVVMAGYNIFNQSADRSIFPLCQKKNVGVLSIYTVRNAFRDKERLMETIANLKCRGLLENKFTTDEFLALIPRGETLASVAYKFAAANAAVTTAMVTSSNIAHLRENSSIFATPDLPDDLISKFRELFNRIAIPVGT
ncbi:MAG: NADH-specific methylglyoxal reductase [Candidatus Moanabacter tarae]|uniref:NADH-specific methylglyoxal reductase n=1 Tax=Candidatus Moanibacter tarae TaxID=2200854 RepID=A0A2Z4ADT7_9BACT|nr:MAG: NADH-specific methylglyoxal reductase [Candidatus Moanabacter tarae]|tara:strand:- start:1614 stop:2552 length:939 start_codon:yes stop_codon:yes gene_type:complete